MNSIAGLPSLGDDCSIASRTQRPARCGLKKCLAGGVARSLHRPCNGVSERDTLLGATTVTRTARGVLFGDPARSPSSPPRDLLRTEPLESISFRAHSGSVCGGPDMPQAGPIEGKTFFCPHCGALYSVTHPQFSKSDSNIAKCVVCQLIMDKGDSAKRSIYKLIHRPEDA